MSKQKRMIGREENLKVRLMLICEIFYSSLFALIISFVLFKEFIKINSRGNFIVWIY